MAVIIELDGVVPQGKEHVVYVKVKRADGGLLKNLSVAYDGDKEKFKDAIRQKAIAVQSEQSSHDKVEAEIRAALTELGAEIEGGK